MNLSAVVLTKNEEKNIKRCLKSLDFCNEIIIVDDYSTDKTINQVLEIKKQNKKIKINIFKRDLNDDFAQQRNFGLKKATNNWVLFIDADEEVSEELKEEIKEIFSIKYSILEKKNIVAFYIKRRDFWWGKELRYGEISKLKNKGTIRLIHRNSGKWMGKVHEEFKIMSKNKIFLWKKKLKSPQKKEPDFQIGKVERLSKYLNHYPHPTLNEFLKEINFYSSLRAKELFFNGKKTNIFEICFFPFLKFLLNYFFYLGFLDGAAGFAYAFLMSFHSFLVRAKLFQMSLKNKIT